MQLSLEPRLRKLNSYNRKPPLASVPPANICIYPHHLRITVNEGRVRRVCAREILCKDYPQDSSTGSFQVRKEWNEHGKSVEWWTSGASAHGKVLDRDLRYLAAYLEMAREADNSLWATGLPMDDHIL